MRRELRNVPTTVYLLFDAADRLIYVGISADTPNRFRVHRNLSPWWGEVARVEEHLSVNRDEAQELEACLIAGRQPVYNQQHVGRRDQTAA